MDVIWLWMRAVAGTVAGRVTRSERGASLVEYGLLVVALTLLLVFGAYKTLGRTVSSRAGG